MIDPPGHPNVGDSAILLGELDFLARYYPEAEVCFYDVDSYSERADKFINDTDLLLLHGGGNFGDIWRHHHDLRLRILERFPGKRIIQLPQSLSFSDERVLRQTADLIELLRNFTLLVRDRRSFVFAERHFRCPIALMPDMAFAMTPIRRLAPQVDCFCLFRGDKEVTADHRGIVDAVQASGRTFETGDWLDDSSHPVTLADRTLLRVTRRAPDLTAPFRSQVMALRRRYASIRLAVGIDRLSRGRSVITDRLHAHILSCLLGIPNIVLDSFDGKISAFFETWSGTCTTAWLASSPDDVRRLLASALVD